MLEQFQHTNVEHALRRSPRPLYAHEVKRAIRRRHSFVSPVDIEKAILELRKDGKIIQQGRRYQLALAEQEENRDKSAAEYSPDWNDFRSLCSYYTSCLLATEGASAVWAVEENGTRFIQRTLKGIEYRESGTPWTPFSYKIDPDLARFLSAKKDDDRVVLGYPLLLFKSEEDPPQVLPVCCLRVELEEQLDSVMVTSQNPIMTLNEKFESALLGFRIPRDRISQFKSMLSTAPAEQGPSFDHVGSLVASFFPELCSDKGMKPANIKWSDFRTLATSMPIILNSAVLMCAKRPRYNLRLTGDIQYIMGRSDEELEQTALSSFFGSNNEGANTEEAPRLAPTFKLTHSQLNGVNAILKGNLAAITGPPGSGKSEIVTSLVRHCLIKKRSLLFTSYNHKAIQAVHERTKGSDATPLLQRFNTSEDSDALRLTSLLDNLKQISNSDFDSHLLERQLREAAALDDEVNAILQEIEVRHRQEQSACEKEQELEKLLKGYNTDLFDSLVCLGGRAVRRICQRLLRTDILAPVARLVSRIVHPAMHRLIGEFVASYSSEQGSHVEGTMPRSGITALENGLKLHDELRHLLEPKKNVEDITLLAERYDTALAQLIRKNTAIMNQRLDEPYHAVDKIKPLQNALKDWKKSQRARERPTEWSPSDSDCLRHALRTVGCSAASLLSVGRFFPLVPGLFDYAVIDEASAATFPSAIPVLYRAKKVGIVGDPHQLPPVIKLNSQLNERYLTESKLNFPWVRGYDYTSRSLFDVSELATALPQRILLLDNFRSHEDIVEYSNSIRYDGKIRARACKNGMRFGLKTEGIAWHDVKTTPPSGYNNNASSEELEEVINILERLIRNEEEPYSGTIGIISPFLDQSRRIEDAIEKKFTFAEREKHQLLASTVHAFQGGERDCIIFSLCGRDSLREGAKAFLNKDSRILNVAISRARASLFIVGDLEWAKNSPVSHIRLLAEAKDGRLRQVKKTPWAPHESPWEKKLAIALKDAGLEPIPQYPVRSRRLDLALIDESNGVFLDIEVDGCAYHRRSDGGRKSEDLWRNFELRAQGWNVIRFWVYELREDMARCVKDVQKKFEERRGAK